MTRRFWNRGLIKGNTAEIEIAHNETHILKVQNSSAIKQVSHAAHFAGATRG